LTSLNAAVQNCEQTVGSVSDLVLDQFRRGQWGVFFDPDIFGELLTEKLNVRGVQESRGG
jgi:hypothetical protein